MHIASSPEAATFILRMPWARETETYSLRPVGHDLLENSVAVLPFSAKMLTVYSCREAGMPAELPLFLPPQPVPSATPRLKYDEAITYYIENLKKMATEGTEGKVVGARVITAPPKAFRASIYDSLEKLYPQAFVFYLSTPETGSWMGASPELLLRRRGDRLETVALAGTRPVGSSGDWDEKNVREQRMVKDFICEILERHGLKPLCEKEKTHAAGPVEHILTEISAEVPEGFGLSETGALITDLSPTPALCGLPRDAALRMLGEKESFPRHLYGGCIGRVKRADDWCFFVNLRSALLTTKGTFLYVGGGITALSDPVKEWEETELKSVTMLKVFAPAGIRVPGQPQPQIHIGTRRRRRRKPRMF